MANEFVPILRDPVTVTVAGRGFVLPWRPAAVWCAGASRPSVLASLLADQDQRDGMADLVLETPGAAKELARESLRILSEACGRKWWEGNRLINTSIAPEILGRLVLAGVDPWARSVGEWTAAVYAMCVKGLDEKARLRLDFRLSLPPAGYEDEWDDEGGDDPEAVANAVQAMMGNP